jgi:hypothetical protein
MKNDNPVSAQASAAEARGSGSPTICAECRYLKERVGQYRYWCDADRVVITPERFNYVTGKTVAASYLPSDESRWSKNGGACRFFEPKQKSPKPRPWWRRLLAEGGIAL